MNKELYVNKIEYILNYIQLNSENFFTFIDIETTGLKGPKHEQITQMSAIVIKYNFSENEFKVIDKFDEKIKLNNYIKSIYTNENERIKDVLRMNRYGSGDFKYKPEKTVFDLFFNFLKKYENSIIFVQNSEFDIKYISVRSNRKIKNRIFDTKKMIQFYFLPLLKTLADHDLFFKILIDKIGTSARDNNLLSSSMSRIGLIFDLDMSGYHDSLVDCELTIKMFIEIVKYLKTYQYIDIREYQSERFKYLK